MKLAPLALNPVVYLFALWMLWAVQPALATERRVALVIGNAAYQGQSSLGNPGNDAADMGRLLSGLGFNGGRVKPQINLGRKAMNAAIDDFMTQAENADLALVYFSGHGMQVDGESFLIPTDAQIENERDIRSDGIRLGDLMEDLERRRIRHTLIVLDACRDNPYRTRTRGATRGLAPPKEMNSAYLVAYATADGQTADDGSGRNGTFTTELLRHLGKPGVSLRDAVEDTQLAVEASTRGQQRPKLYGDTAKFRSVYLAGSPSVRVPSVRPEPIAQPVPPAVVQAKPAQPAAQPAQAGKTFKDCAGCPEMVAIPAGSFDMGSNDLYSDEKPVHRVNVSSFLIGKTEVTQGLWKAVMGSNPSRLVSCGDNCPVTNVTWDDAQQFIQKLNQKTGQNYRLPSEAEWEYAARAGSITPWSFGDNESALGKYAWYSSNSGDKIHPVGQKQANAFGLYDMHGNVWEYVEDCFHDTYRGAPTDGSAWTEPCSYGFDLVFRGRRVLRGGSCAEEPAGLGSARRGEISPDDSFIKYISAGFRLARTAP